MAASRRRKILAVDFGTSTCSAGIHEPAGPKLVVDQGEAAIPSVVFFPGTGDAKVGRGAQQMLATQPTNTVRSIKRIVGRTWGDREVVGHSRALHYPLREGPGARVVLGLSSGEVTCEQVVSNIFRVLREHAERRFACRVEQVVATVPADASAGYEAALRRAAALAHLKIIETLPEPVAGALPLRLHLEPEDRKVLVCDFGGGTFDVTLIDAGLRRLDVLASDGDDYLGGDDFDEKLMEAIASVVFSRSSFDMLRDAAVRARLLLRCEEAKRALSSRSEVRLFVKDVYRNGGAMRSIDSIVERAWVEPRWQPLIDRALTVITRLLARVGLEVEEVDQVALIGGTSLVPLFRRCLTGMFRPGVILPEVGAATAVVEGAILRCAAYEQQQAEAARPALVRSRG